MYKGLNSPGKLDIIIYGTLKKFEPGQKLELNFKKHIKSPTKSEELFLRNFRHFLIQQAVDYAHCTCSI